MPFSQPYSLTKAALYNLSSSFFAENHKYFDVKVITPGFVDTPLTRKNKFDVYTRAPWIPYKYKVFKLVSVSDKLYEKTAKGIDDKSQVYSPFYQFCDGRDHERHEEAVREFMNDNNINHILLDATQCEKWDKSNWRTIGIKDGMVLMSPL